MSVVFKQVLFSAQFWYDAFGAQPASRRRRREDVPLKKETKRKKRIGWGLFLDEFCFKIDFVFSAVSLGCVWSAASVEKNVACREFCFSGVLFNDEFAA